MLKMRPSDVETLRAQGVTVNGKAVELPNVTWTVSNSKIAKVDDIVVTADKKGSTQLTAQVGVYKTTIPLEVQVPVSSITVTNSSGNSYIPIGNIASRVGRKKTILAGIALMSLCYFAAVFVGAYHPLVNIAFAAIGVGWAAINVNSYPMIVEMSKGCDIGKFTGTYYTFSMTAQIFTPVLSGFLLENVSYRTLFPYAFVFSALAFATMTQVRHGDVRPDKKKSILENFDVDD